MLSNVARSLRTTPCNEPTYLSYRTSKDWNHVDPINALLESTPNTVSLYFAGFDVWQPIDLGRFLKPIESDERVFFGHHVGATKADDEGVLVKLSEKMSSRLREPKPYTHPFGRNRKQFDC